MARKVRNNMVWNELLFIDTKTNQEKWRLQGPFIHDTMAGFIIAGYMLLSLTDDNEYIFRGTNPALTEINSIDDLGRNYVRNRAIAEDQTDQNPQLGLFGIWVFNSEDEDGSYWDLVQVRNLAEFMQGFITMCNAFGVDFRYYLLSLPFRSDGSEYDLPEYGLQTYINEMDEEYPPDDEDYDPDDLDY